MRKKVRIKKKRKVYYVSPYMPEGKGYEKHYSVAAQSKVGYIRSLFKKEELITVCVNCSLTVDNLIILPKIVSDENGKCRVVCSISCVNRLFLPFCGLIMYFSLFMYLFFNVRKQDTIVLYHSIYYDMIAYIIKKIRKCKIIYEVEEVYADVRDGGMGREEEIRKCRKMADAFIFPTELLNKEININNIPYLIVYGAYLIPNNKVMKKVNKEKIRIVYSGTLMEGKGADEVVECAKYLDEKYEIRIIGYGRDEEIEKLLNRIANIESKCVVHFDGVKYGNEYMDYLMKCDIGLCIQPLHNLFNKSSFPSKVLSYFNAGLKIITNEIPAVVQSRLSKYITFAHSTEPMEVARAIKESEKMFLYGNDLVEALDREAKTEMRILLHDLYSLK